ncbi:hypothetical protein A5674_04140 [Mycobacterium malmoense]|nr:hypothetical protein A5674_04140 [Mycobacterium malmoense]
MQRADSRVSELPHSPDLLAQFGELVVPLNGVRAAPRPKDIPLGLAVLVVSLGASLWFDDEVDSSVAPAIDAPIYRVMSCFSFLVSNLIEDLSRMSTCGRSGDLFGHRPRRHQLVTVLERGRVARPHLRTEPCQLTQPVRVVDAARPGTPKEHDCDLWFDQFLEDLPRSILQRAIFIDSD